MHLFNAKPATIFTDLHAAAIMGAALALVITTILHTAQSENMATATLVLVAVCVAVLGFIMISLVPPHAHNGNLKIFLNHLFLLI